jgi:Polyphosphate kinase 2 (PPK2)
MSTLKFSVFLRCGLGVLTADGIGRRWVEYARAKDEMFKHTDMPSSPWWVVPSDDKKVIPSDSMDSSVFNH